MTQNTFKDKVVLITGGTGSFGSAFAKRLLIQDECSKVIIFSRDELKQWEMQQANPIYNHPKIRFFLGDIRDKQRLMRAFRDVNVIVHAAALKQVPAAEYNPTEFIQTNILGANNIIDAAIDCGVEKIIALSSDKSVNPINLYGATKLCSDKLFIAGNAYVGAKSQTIFSVVRYGNVVGSRGSVIPLWRKMISEGTKSLPITDPRMTRFWITMDQSIDLVLLCSQKMIGGEIFVPKIPSMKITDLAMAMAPQLPSKVIGIRPGEKLHELLISQHEALHTFEFDSHYIIIPEIWKGRPSKNQNLWKEMEGITLPDDFVYASNTNKQWLTIEDLQKLLHTRNL